MRDAAGSRCRTRRADLDLATMFADVLQIDPATIGPGPQLRRPRREFTVLRDDVGAAGARARSPARRLAATPLRELESAPRRARRWWGATLETSVALRAVAIVLVVGSHAELFELWGGAHILLGIAGYNFGRFCLTPLPRTDRVRHLRNTTAWIAAPTVLWVALALVITDDYTASNLLLANKFLGPNDSMTAGRLWFVEVVVWILVALAAVCWLPLGDRLERQWPFGFAVAFLAFGLALRYDVFGSASATARGSRCWRSGSSRSAGPRRRRPRCGSGSRSRWCWPSACSATSEPRREVLVFAGLALLIWLPAIRCPAALPSSRASSPRPRCTSI